jgi:hypothetical protein
LPCKHIDIRPQEGWVRAAEEHKTLVLLVVY